MTQLQTKFFTVSSEGFSWADSTNINNAMALFSNNGSGSWEFTDHTGGSPSIETVTSDTGRIAFTDNTKASYGDSFDTVTGTYTFAEGKANRFLTPTIDEHARPFTLNNQTGLYEGSAGIVPSFGLHNTFVLIDFNTSQQHSQFRLYASKAQRDNAIAIGTYDGSNNDGTHFNANLEQDANDSTKYIVSAWNNFTSSMLTFVITKNGNVVTLDTAPSSQPTPNPVDNINTGMGANYYEEDLTTNVRKYFGEAFKFDGSQFEMDGDRVVGIKQSFIDNIAIDLTNIVNTSIKTATLEADNATINNTLTALGINVTGLLSATGLDVGIDGLTIEDNIGHKHRLNFGKSDN